MLTTISMANGAAGVVSTSRPFNESICDHLSGLICKQGMTCYGVITPTG